MKQEESLVEQLIKAKKNTQYLLDNAEGLVDMKGLYYWAGEVERLRGLVKII